MDFDPEEVLRLMLPDRADLVQSWAANPDVAEFLCELGACGYADAEKTVRRIELEAASNLERTRDLAFHNYGTFIETADCARDVAKDFVGVEENLQRFVDGCPGFVAQCGDFREKAQKLMAHRRLASLALARHTQLLEILELPQLMDTCVRNGYCEEALQLAQYVERLQKKHGKIPVIQDIVHCVQRSQRLLVKQLLAQIGSPTQLPQCLKLLGYLRRLEVFTPAQLRVKFLQARTAWLKSAIEGVLRDDPYYYLNKVIELHRVHLFDIITQYRALFSGPAGSAKDDSVDLPAIFYSWVFFVIKQFLETVDAGLTNDPKVVARMDSLFGQCNYFATSLSRVGVDFSPRVHQLFSKAAMRNLTEAIDSSLEQFKSRLATITSASIDSVRFTEPASRSEDLHPPLSLLDFQALAYLANDLLRALNDFSACAQLRQGLETVKLFETKLRVAGEMLAAVLRREGGATSGVAKLFTRAFVPHMALCLRSLCGPDRVKDVLGSSCWGTLHLELDVGSVNVALVEFEETTK
ncbi:unnamed protein product, partial [Notodromas monacha]